MKQTHKEMKTEEVEVLDDVLCNKCGASLKGSCGYEGLVEAVIEGGYDSEYVGDCCSVRFSLCEKCLKELIDSFKLPADWNKTRDYIEEYDESEDYYFVQKE